MAAAKEFAKAFTTKRLRQIYAERVRLSKSIGLDRKLPEKLSTTLGVEILTIQRKVAAGNYTFTPYKEKLISKGAGSNPRVVSIPTARDRLVLRAMCEFLRVVFPDAVPELPQTKIESLKAALASGKFGEYVKIDLKNFYPSLPHSQLHKSLRAKIRKPQILQLFKNAVQAPTVPESKGGKGSVLSVEGVPQGLAISNLLAEISLRNVDRQFLSRTDIWYARYVDDILLLGESGSAQGLASQLTNTLKDLGLTPHEVDAPNSKSKIGLLSEAIVFLGYRVEGNKISIRPESTRRFESSIASIFTAYRHRLLSVKSPAENAAALLFCEWRLNLRITGCVFKGQRLGWAFYFSQINDTTRLRALNSTIQILLKRFSLAGKLKPKSLLKVHYECKRRDKLSHRYIPNFDTMDIAERRRILGLYLGSAKVAPLSNARVNELFEMRISIAVKELEADLAGLS